MEPTVNSKQPLNDLTLQLGLCDTDTIYHSQRVGKLSKVLLEEYVRQNSPTDLEYTPQMLEWAALLHDIGKQRVKSKTLTKNANLTPEEFQDVKNHVLYGEEILKEHKGKDYPALRRLAHDVILYHHERADGNGYNQGLTEEQTPLSAQIVALADCYDALVGARAYKAPLDPETAVEKITRGECGAFSRALLKCLPVVLDL